MKKIILFIILFGGNFIFSQVESGQKPLITINPLFYYNAISYLADDTSHTKVDLYLQVPYNQITFVKEGDKYASSYEVTATFLDKNENIVVEKIWKEKILLNSYEESISNKSFNLTMRSFKLKPADYKLKLRLENRESSRNGSAELIINVRNFRDFPFALSDILIVGQITEKDGIKSIVPNITRNIVFNKDGFYILADFYKFVSDSVYNIKCQISNNLNEVMFDTSMVMTLTQDKSQLFLKISKESFPFGEYTLSLISYRLNDTIPKYTVSKKIISKWIGIPLNITDLDKAIDQMIYITDKDKINELKEIEDKNLKLLMFMKFWKDKDPSKNTDENELMEEYYSRIEYSTKHFSNFLEGWKSDMGMVFVVLGPPDNVERYPFNYDAPAHEVWQYYRINKSFVFVDYNGFGDYRLVSRDFAEFFRYR